MMLTMTSPPICHTTPEAKADPDKSDSFAPTDHLYKDPPPDPHAPTNLDPDTPFPAPTDPTDNEGDGARTPANEGDMASDLENEGGVTRENEGSAVRNRNEENKGARTGSHCQRGAPTTFQSRSGRTVKVSDRVLDWAESFGSTNPMYSTKLAMAHFVAFMTTMLDDHTFNEFHPLAYVASLADKDSMNFIPWTTQSRPPTVRQTAIQRRSYSAHLCPQRKIRW
jgi:hypothetical protein